MKLKKIIKHDEGRQIWRLLINQKNQLLVEERDINTKSVFYSLLDLNSKKHLLKSHQFDEKFWIGIEAFTDDVLVLHKFVKPDMPTHKGMIAYSLIDKKVKWENERLQFLYVKEKDIYCFSQKFEAKEFYIVDLASGEIKENLGSDFNKVNKIKNQIDEASQSLGYIFPEALHPIRNENAFNIVQKVTNKYKVKGSFDALEFKGYIFVNCHTENKDGTLNNNFQIVDTGSNKIIFEELLNKKVNSIFVDSFFIKDDFLFLLIEKSGVNIYRIEI
ncbi:MAG: DUF4905 domain-containing protein [Ignavibacteriaceae bacterium]|nr:DUF4905 domain-containing protein [Ignavibacteriaceae bacterium]